MNAHFREDICYPGATPIRTTASSLLQIFNAIYGAAFPAPKNKMGKAGNRNSTDSLHRSADMGATYRCLKDEEKYGPPPPESPARQTPLLLLFKA